MVAVMVASKTCLPPVMNEKGTVYERYIALLLLPLVAW